MLRILLLVNILLLNLYACKGGYHSCKRKIIDSHAIVNQNIKLPISKKETLIFAQNISTIDKNLKIIKTDPFLSLYLVKSKKYFRYPFKLNRHHTLGVSAVDKKMALEGKIRKQQIGLNSFATFNDALFAPSLLMTSCCSIEGLITPKGIINKDYIRNFLNSKKIQYGDIGIRAKDKDKNVVIRASDPFMKHNPFKKNDYVLTFDGKKIKNSSSLMKKILFSKIGTAHKVKVKRKGKILNFKVITQKRYGGGYISDTFLEQKGIYFDKNLSITKIEKKSNSYGLKIGDRLIQANGVKIDGQYKLLDNIGNFKESSLLLFQRAGFQFFVHIN